MGNKVFENFQMDELKDKVIVLLGKTGVGKSTFINCITNTDKCKIGKGHKSCTKEIQQADIMKNGINYYFVDTPGLDDNSGDKKNIDQLNSIKQKCPKINAFIICVDFHDCRLYQSLVETIKKFIEIFPCPNFWEHVLILRTKAARSQSFAETRTDTEGEFLEGIKESEELNSFMEANKIIKPKELKEYFVECKEKDQDTLNELEKILQEIKNIYPLYKEIKEREEEIIEQEIRDGIHFIRIKLDKHITFIDFDGKTHEIVQHLQNELYNLDGLVPSLTEVKREQTEEPRGKYCWKNQFKTNYYLIKLYNVNGSRIRTRQFLDYRWEHKDQDIGMNEGEIHRNELEKKLATKLIGI